MAAFIPDSAFDPMLCDTIVVEGKRNVSGSVTRPVSGTFRASVMENGYAEPTSDQDAERKVLMIVVWVKEGDWIEKSPPQVGDRIFLENGRQFAVKEAGAPFGGIWPMEAWEVAE